MYWWLMVFGDELVSVPPGDGKDGMERHRLDATVLRSAVRLSLQCWPEGRLELGAESSAFFVGDIADVGEAPPDYCGDESAIQAGLTGWRSGPTGQAHPAS